MRVPIRISGTEIRALRGLRGTRGNEIQGHQKFSLSTNVGLLFSIVKKNGARKYENAPGFENDASVAWAFVAFDALSTNVICRCRICGIA